MSGNERTVEDAAAEDPAASGDTDAADESADHATDHDAAAHDATDHDAAAETFLELDAELADERGVEPGESPSGSAYRRGLVADVERTDAAAVPEGYPLDADADRVVALTVDFGDESTTVYLAWPGDATGETALSRLLSVLDCSFGDLYGERVLVDRVDGFDVLVTPRESPRGSGTLGVGVLGGGVLTALVTLMYALASGSFPDTLAWYPLTHLWSPVGMALHEPLWLLWLVLSFVWLPYAVYGDAWYLRTHSDWDGGPLFWATLSAVPFLNLVVVAVYLRQRAGATFLGDEPSLLGRVAGAVRSVF